MKIVIALRALSNERRLQNLEWLREPRKHFPEQADHRSKGSQPGLRSPGPDLPQGPANRAIKPVPVRLPANHEGGERF